MLKRSSADRLEASEGKSNFVGLENRLSSFLGLGVEGVVLWGLVFGFWIEDAEVAESSSAELDFLLLVK